MCKKLVLVRGTPNGDVTKSALTFILLGPRALCATKTYGGVEEIPHASSAEVLDNVSDELQAPAALSHTL